MSFFAYVLRKIKQSRQPNVGLPFAGSKLTAVGSRGRRGPLSLCAGMRGLDSGHVRMLSCFAGSHPTVMRHCQTRRRSSCTARSDASADAPLRSVLLHTATLTAIDLPLERQELVSLPHECAFAHLFHVQVLVCRTRGPITLARPLLQGLAVSGRAGERGRFQHLLHYGGSGGAAAPTATVARRAHAYRQQTGVHATCGMYQLAQPCRANSNSRDWQHGLL